VHTKFCNLRYDLYCTSFCNLRYDLYCTPFNVSASSWSWLYGSLIYNYLCKWKCEFEPRSWRDVLDTTLCEQVCQWLATGRWFPPVAATNKADLHNITEILLKVALNTINQTNQDIDSGYFKHLILRVPDKGYSRKDLCTLNQISTFLFISYII
jgi:hypothetical protein